MPRYPAPYPTMIRPGFPPRPIPPAGVIPQIPRPPIPSIRGVPPVVTPVIRPMIPIVAPAEKPQTTVYVGKIAATVENEFLLSILTLNINQATREYLERYVEKKREKIKEAETGGPAKESNIKDGSETQVPTKPVEEGTKKDSEDSGDKENQDSSKKFGIVTDEDREADRETLEKLTNMIEERLKNKPLPPPPVDGSAKLTCEVGSKSRDGDSDVDVVRSDAAEDKNDDETTSENKPGTESDKPETSSPDKSRRHDRSRERDRERDLKRDKERELERVERERERERVRRERERELKVREAERLYKDRLKEWESREREKEYQRQYEKEREKERERERRREILRQEEESSGDDDDDSRKRRRRSVILEERRRKRQREKEEDLDDRSKEEEEITEAKRRAVEEQQLKLDSRNSSADDLNMVPVAPSDTKQNNNIPARKLGFGLIGSGKRTTVPSVFHEEDDEDVDEKKMRPLVPIDYSTEELQAVQINASAPQPNLVAASEFAKRISGVNPKEEKSDVDRERNRRSSDKLSLRERDRNDGDSSRSKDESREKMHEKNVDREKGREDKQKTENKKLLDAKQLIDMIPKTKEELFVYEINWDVYDKVRWYLI
ncbi:hypothetical protein B296_00052348 [Ensete ventricosum]|uniref:PWI domain-containing protein n=1 Tax=Ensete ventricosum TaxID=4639 RepID=A0A426YCR6_ENSVE|nr:hypothetical protein B296_00052348 [Ensete ventricosum]